MCVSNQVSNDQETLLPELLIAVSDPLTVAILIVESLKPGQVLSETDHRMLLQALNHANKIIRCVKSEQNV